jgi:1-aminocyclopropane-1-carboxylate deaminase
MHFLMQRNQNTLHVTGCQHMLRYKETPLQEILDPAVTASGIRLLVKREDLNHPHSSGNKWWKLKYNLDEARRQGKETILTFGGAYSNHIYATAAAARESGLGSIGVIRGEESFPLNPTLSFAKKCGMILQFVSRTSYRNKHSTEFIMEMNEKWNCPYILPEGGTNDLAVRGIREFGLGLKTFAFEYLCVSVGTGGTIAGLIQAMENSTHVIGFPAIKGGEKMTADIQKWLGPVHPGNWHLEAGYHQGGYARVNRELLAFMREFEEKNGFRLDPVYTGKMMFGLFDLVHKGYFKRGSTVVAIHTGGVQGWAGIS